MERKGKRSSDALRMLFENASARACGHDMPHKILTVGTAGGVCCVRVAGYVTALNDQGLLESSTDYLGISGSSAVFAGALSGFASRAHFVFEHLADPRARFMVRKGLRKRLRLRYLEKILSGEHSPVCVSDKKIQEHPSGFSVAITRRKDGRGKLVDAKTYELGAVAAICASMTVPRLCDPQRDEEGEEVIDGACCGLPYTINEAIRKIKPDALLLLSSRTHPHFFPWTERWFWSTFARMVFLREAKALRESVALMDYTFASHVKRLEALKRIAYAQIRPDAGDIPLPIWAKDPHMVRKSWSDAACFMRQELLAHRPRVMI